MDRLGSIRALVVPLAMGLVPLSVGEPAHASSSTGAQEIRIAVGDLTFDALSAGPEAGEAVLLLHGFPETFESFRNQVIALGAAGYRAIAPNQRGYSPDARPDGVEAYEMANLVGDVVGMADRLGIDRFHVVGHDWGGWVAWYLAALHPDRLISLTVLASPHPAAFAEAVAVPGSEQAGLSSYMDFFRTDGAEDVLLANDAEFFHMDMTGEGVSPELAREYLGDR